jgi:hypothetical protein
MFFGTKAFADIESLTLVRDTDAETVYKVVYTHEMGNHDTKSMAMEYAAKSAKIAAVEASGSYVVLEDTVVDDKLKTDIHKISSGIVTIKILSDGYKVRDGIVIYFADMEAHLDKKSFKDRMAIAKERELVRAELLGLKHRNQQLEVRLKKVLGDQEKDPVDLFSSEDVDINSELEKNRKVGVYNFSSKEAYAKIIKEKKSKAKSISRMNDMLSIIKGFELKEPELSHEMKPDGSVVLTVHLEVDEDTAAYQEFMDAFVKKYPMQTNGGPDIDGDIGCGFKWESLKNNYHGWCKIKERLHPIFRPNQLWAHVTVGGKTVKSKLVGLKERNHGTYYTYKGNAAAVFEDVDVESLLSTDVQVSLHFGGEEFGEDKNPGGRLRSLEISDWRRRSIH